MEGVEARTIERINVFVAADRFAEFVGQQNCASCRLFTAPNACEQVEGDISPNGWCRIWSKAG